MLISTKASPMTSSKEIKCPNCNTVFKIDKTNYLAIQSQVRDQLFEEQLKAGITNAVKLSEQQLTNKHNQFINKQSSTIKELQEQKKSFDKDKKYEISEATKTIEKEKIELETKNNNLMNKLTLSVAKLENEKKLFLNEKDGIIKDHNKQISSLEKDKIYAISEATKLIEEEKNKIQIKFSKSEAEFKLKENNLKNKHNQEIKDKDEEITRIKENKSKLSTKMVGESLEESCSIEYETFIRRSIPTATYKKDNEVVNKSKGDYIFRMHDENGNEIVSIMFDMKNEDENSKVKQKNKDCYQKLDKDRKNKNCEYAVLVSTLEPENEQFNTGMTTVYHEYKKMIVIRPNCFISLILTLIELGREILECKLLLEEEKTKSIDITNFKDSLDKLQKSSEYNINRIFSSINEIIKKQDKIISTAQETKEIAVNSLSKNYNMLNKKIQSISVNKLIKDNPTMIKLFDEQSDKEVVKEQ